MSLFAATILHDGRQCSDFTVLVCCKAGPCILFHCVAVNPDDLTLDSSAKYL